MTPDKPTKVVAGDYVFEFQAPWWKIVAPATAADRETLPVVEAG